jgi:hypothetical protein
LSRRRDGCCRPPEDIRVKFTRPSVDSAIALPLLHFGEIDGVAGVDLIADVAGGRRVVTLEPGIVGVMFSVPAGSRIRVSVNQSDSGRLQLCHDNVEDFDVGASEAFFPSVKLCDPP